MYKRKGSTPLTYNQLKTMHTRRLLARRDFMYRLWCKGTFRNTRYERCYYDEYIIYDGDEATALQERAWIKEILATREHIPNKKESRAIRQAKAKAKKNR